MAILEMMDGSKYVKSLPDGSFEIKPGAGQLPVIMTREQYEYLGVASYGTALIPSPLFGGIEEFIKLANVYAMVKEYLANGNS